MRLVCPNCGAQYEVDDRVMPESGRDVQCSSCGHAWFHLPTNDSSGSDKSSPDASKSVADESPADAWEEPDVDFPDGDIEEAFEDVPADEDDDDAADEDLDDAPAPDLPRREIDDGVKSILQEEAERELAARASDQDSLETQTEMGLDDTGNDEREGLKSRVARLRGFDDEFASPSGAGDAKGRDVLPDIEEINSTLDAPAHDPGNLSPDDLEAKPSGGGFTRGFAVAILIAAMLTALYTFAPALSARVPQLEAILGLYVDLIDQFRLWLETTMRAAIDQMQGFVDQPEG